jgi:hypothetical protein
LTSFEMKVCMVKRVWEFFSSKCTIAWTKGSTPENVTFLLLRTCYWHNIA